MTILTIENLKKIIEHIPDDFTVELKTKDTITTINDTIEVDISGKRLILQYTSND